MSTNKDRTFDVVVVGGGPGGYVCAIRAAQLGLSVACVEKRGALGGTCLNVGCIPSKVLLQSSHHYRTAKEELAEHGVKVAGVELDLPAMMGRKDKVVADFTKGVEFLFKKNKVAYFKGAAALTGPNALKVSGEDGEAELTAKTVVIATGSVSAPLPGVAVDEKTVVSSTGALALPKVPKSMVVIGAGVIGLELGSVWARLGAEVTVVEFLGKILPPFDDEVSKQMQRILEKQGMSFKLAHKVTGVTAGKSGATVSVEPVKGGDALSLEADVVLVAIGRRPYTEGLGLEAAGVAVSEKGFIPVDAHGRTNVPSIYAIGDVAGGLMLAHKAEEEGVAVAETIAGQAGHVNHGIIPSVVYTHPEVASVGKTEQELKAEGTAYAVGKFPFIANSRAKANGDAPGFVKILADKRTDRVLGAHLIGPGAGELIAEVAVAMEFSASAEDIARTCHAHPSLSEAVKEAALDTAKRAIHI
ncbi:dihydrolipoyl dehydrogenase [Oleispirillum naphthae]|uniref:dihydrolipoyl dehydrogenase n=1 Tax=Oleispirillum naphthae TaxID=2838853 RepID=UPI00308252B8